MKYANLTAQIIKSAMEVHNQLGPGLLESAYEECLVYELRRAGLKAETQIPVPLVYKDIKLDCGYRIDILVEDKVIIEVKSADAILPVHEAQILTYLKLAHKEVGLLINFNVKHLKEGIRRFVMGVKN
ncbi:MAG TPA: GxxExxY protein [Candidatus Marinimicrobia bacterium]|nr:GxxExxY protein [Candidatus Neomarinimicrobiota bacterium]HRS51605.1 GxxExxY protein [Candidatus Neomarinimicrobiota bacterium]HRU92317.1 GxxExxY protein [Candidatus Neomarinimicrobiota bacterium]